MGSGGEGEGEGWKPVYFREVRLVRIAAVLRTLRRGEMAEAAQKNSRPSASGLMRNSRNHPPGILPMSVADIESITGITFFSDIPAAVKNQCAPGD